MMRLSRATAVGAALAAALTAAGCGGGSGSSASHPAVSPVAEPHHQPAGATCPLTGATATHGQQPKRAALAVKIDNVDDARPQVGLNSADIVVEELVEGGLTRLMAIYQCSQAGSVGPIRSARISDADLLALLHGSVLGYSGANPADLPPIEAHGKAVLISADALPQYFHRDLSRAAPHNVFSSTATLLAAGRSRRHSLHAPHPLFRYGDLARNAKPAGHVALTWPAATAAWTWQHGHYLRTQNGTPDRQAGGAQLSAANVIVLGVSIASTGLHDVLGSASPLDVTVGSNPAWVFRNGKEVTGTWKRRNVTSKLKLRDHHGHTIRLAPGRSWIELLPRPATPQVAR